ncbi:hypothetical protein SAMN04489712_105494 [Thermomonospora echinospora]|uniref:Uncharacterized protein n=1 Tax=Thermomonospora echinospora TaxID=1992 RepID=A0A1H6AK19_9ACTN|nr:hypothetical protein [Thermomonospora echinospora]SEG48752.1 hypothetical protein SAMN04489712_105494 [Thermomonospora echinospora]
MARHLKAVPEPPSGSAHAASPGGRPAEPADETFLHRVLAATLARVQPGAGQITVERLERDDGTLITYLDAADVVAVYTGQTTHGSPQADSGTDAGPVVIDVHRRTDAAQRRLRFLLDDAPAWLLALEPAQFRVVASAGSPQGSLELICVRCQDSVPAEPSGLLHMLLETAAQRSCPAEPAWANGADPCD